VRAVCRECFGVEIQEDWALQQAPAPEEVTKYNLEEIGGPNLDSLRIDMRGKLFSNWNKAVGNLLLGVVLERRRGKAWKPLPERSDAYFLEIVTEQLERARTVWREAQPRVKEDGAVEGLAEVEARMVENKEEKGILSRACTRRKTVSSVLFGYSSNNPNYCW
jgi:hypothetical protein